MDTSSDIKRQTKSPLKNRNLIILIGVIAAIIIVGIAFSGGHAPNSSVGSVFNPLPVYKNGLGAINGYVYGPLGLPAVGATVVASEQTGSTITKTAFISIDGKYVMGNLEPGKYILTVAFPDGTSKVYSNINVDPDSVQTITVKY